MGTNVTRALLVVAAALASGCAGRAAVADPTHVASLDARHRALADDFNRDAALVRILILASPTCPDCLAGVATVRDEVLRDVADPSLRLMVVWLPVLDDDDLAAARKAAGTLRDPRVRQYWDDGRRLGEAMGVTLKIPERRHAGYGFAWDVYLLYPRGTTWPDWLDAPPAPPFFMHQLSSMAGTAIPLLDAPALRSKVRAALATPPP
jgi:hypothetical protein